MKSSKDFLKDNFSRRDFMETTAKVAAVAALAPSIGCSATAGPVVGQKTEPTATPQAWAPTRRHPDTTVRGQEDRRFVLKDGLIADGSGQSAFYGDVLVNGDKIEMVTPGRIDFSGPVVDCSGKVVAPGFIDMHSHMDWVLPMPGRPDMKTPFTEQGVTTFVAGNCGFGVAGFLKNSPHREMITVRTESMYDLYWHTMAEYFDHLRRQGITHNLANLSGHGTSRTTIRGFDPTPMKTDEMRTLLYLLEESMEQGAYGVSLGLQYEPGIFATMEELKQVAEVVKKKDKILTVHMKAYSALSGTYPLEFFGRPHNLLAIEDMIRLAQETGVRLQLSHLIFVGERTWPTCEEALELIDRAVDSGLDIQFDTYAYHCGTSVINVFFPEWFLAQVPAAYQSGSSLFKLRMEILLIEKLLGFGYQDIQITDAKHPDLEQYNGMFIKDIAKKRGMSPFENFVDMAEKSQGRARVLNHRYSNLDNIKKMIRHPAALFMTDATPSPQGVQNPGAFGNFPLFLQYARDFGLISMEECVRKMTGASADRFGIRDRGYLKDGMAADITVFDWQRIRDNNTRALTDRKPTGIDHVWINGAHVLAGGQVDTNAVAGRVL